MNEDWIKFLKESSSVCTKINTEVQIFIQKESWKNKKTDIKKKNSVETKLWRKALLLILLVKQAFLTGKAGKNRQLNSRGHRERVFSTKTQAVRLNSNMVLKPTYFNSIHFAKPALPWQIQKAVNAEIRGTNI